VPEFVTLRLWLLVDPTATLPNVTAAGLTLRLPELLAVLLVAEFVVSVELPLPLVTPEQPLRTDIPSKRKTAQKMEYEFCRLRLGRARRAHPSCSKKRVVISHAALGSSALRKGVWRQ